MRVGSAAFAVKLTNDGSLPEHRAAFIGGESVGKSTAINYITSKGQGDPFMPTGLGMCAQSCCFVTHGLQESFQIGTDRVSACSVNKAVQAFNKELCASPSGWDSLEALRASKPFFPPDDIELVDVPVMKQTTQFDTVLGFSISSVLVSHESLKEQLTDGRTLKLLPSIVSELQESIPIHCLVTPAIQQRILGTADQYKKTLSSYFPGCPITTQYGFFPAMPDMECLEAAVSEVFRITLGIPPKDSDPYKPTMALQPSLGQFTKNLSTKLNLDFHKYFTSLDESVTQLWSRTTKWKCS
jgi:hypothetical protein